MTKMIDTIVTLMTRRLPLTALLLLQLTMALMPASSSRALAAESRKYLWQSREQFVAIQPQEESDTPLPANSHPADLTTDQLRAMLSPLQFADPDKEQPLPLFNGPEIEILAEMLRDGLKSAGLHEDITFAVIGQFPTLFGLASERKVTTGRVFFADGRLNIIFGMVHRDVNDREDRRLAPFTPGQRNREAKLVGKILPQATDVATMKRADWVLLSPVTLPAKQAEPPQGQNQKVLSLPQSAPRVDQAKPARSAAERLKTLNQLKDEKLITDDEYRAKRQEILNSL